MRSLVPARIFTFAVLFGTAWSGLACRGEVLQWQPHDVTFRAEPKAANPFAVDFWAEATAPDGSRRNLPGFYDGSGQWKIRLAPDRPGSWTLVTHSHEPELDGRTSSLTCVARPNLQAHGGLRVDPEHPHHFIFEDGTRWFPLGYECDWLWALDMGDPELKTIRPFLAKLARNGFNFVILNTYAHDTSWRKGRTGPDDFGPPAQYAWEGGNEQPDHSRFNLAYWQHYDRVIDALNQHGIIAHMLIKVYNKHVHWPATDSPEDKMFFRWLLARYAAYPNVVWDLAKESHNEKSLEYKIDRLNYLRANDPYHRLITIHDDRKNVGAGVYDGLIDFVTDQKHGKWHETVLQQRERRAWPVINAEFGYEPGPKGLDDRTYKVVQPIEEVVHRAWEISMAGGYTAYYYTYTAWDVVRPDDTPPGYAMFHAMRSFFESTKYWLLEPSDALVSEGYCLATPGRQYVVYLKVAKPVRLTVKRADRNLKAVWFHTLTGESRPAAELSNGEQTLTPPNDWQGKPVAFRASAE